MLFRLLLGVILLSSVQVDPNYLRIGVGESIIAGMGEFDASMAANVRVSGVWLSVQVAGLLLDPRIAAPVAPLSTDCKSLHKDCLAYILPGQLEWVRNDTLNRDFLDP